MYEHVGNCFESRWHQGGISPRTPWTALVRIQPKAQGRLIAAPTAAMPGLIFPADPAGAQSSAPTQLAQAASFRSLWQTLAQCGAAYWHGESGPARTNLPTLVLITPSLYIQNAATSPSSKPI